MIPHLPRDHRKTKELKTNHTKLQQATEICDQFSRKKKNNKQIINAFLRPHEIVIVSETAWAL